MKKEKLYFFLGCVFWLVCLVAGCLTTTGQIDWDIKASKEVQYETQTAFSQQTD